MRGAADQRLNSLCGGWNLRPSAANRLRINGELWRTRHCRACLDVEVGLKESREPQAAALKAAALH